MAKSNLKSHINSLLQKIASEKTAEELGATSFTSPDNGDTTSIPTGTQEATYNKIEELTAGVSTPNVKSTPDGAVDNSAPAGEDGGIAKLTPDEAGETPKSGKDVGDTTGPKATDVGAGKVASLSQIGNEILALIKSATTKTAKGCGAKGEAMPEEKKEDDKEEEEEEEDMEEEKTAIEHIKQAAEAHPDAFEAGYKYASYVAQVLLAEEQTKQTKTAAARGKVASEAEHAAIKVAEFLMGLEKSAMDPGMIDPTAMGGAPEGAVSPEEIAAAGGEMAPEGMAGMEGASEDEVVEALAAALEAEGITPEELASALEAEAGSAGEEVPAGDVAEEVPEEVPAEVEKEAMERKVKIASTMVDRIQSLKKAGLIKRKGKK